MFIPWSECVSLGLHVYSIWVFLSSGYLSIGLDVYHFSLMCIPLAGCVFWMFISWLDVYTLFICVTLGLEIYPRVWMFIPWNECASLVMDAYLFILISIAWYGCVALWLDVYTLCYICILWGRCISLVLDVYPLGWMCIPMS